MVMFHDVSKSPFYDDTQRGAGTGGTTSFVLPSLDPHKTRRLGFGPSMVHDLGTLEAPGHIAMERSTILNGKIHYKWLF